MVVVGAGSAGLPAAIAVADRGGRVCLVEASGEVGGSLLVSRGQISGAGTCRQAERGIADSAEQHYADAMRASGGRADPAFLALATRLMGPFIDWLCEHGFDMADEVPRAGPGASATATPRTYWGREGGRSILRVFVPMLDAHIAAGRIDLHLRTEAADLLSTKGAVTGLAVSTGLRLEGRSVLLTSGGYAANPELFARIHPGSALVSDAYPFALGRGLEMGLAAGGVLVRGGSLAPSTDGSPIRRSVGGLRVDTDLRVLDAAGAPIPGLYAAGEILGGLFAGAAGARGMSLGPALAFGRYLGERLPLRS